MMLQMIQVYRNTCDRLVNKKHRKSPKGTTRPPKMNKMVFLTNESANKTEINILSARDTTRPGP